MSGKDTGSKKGGLPITIAINESNPTIVAAWDLGRPSTKETRKVLRSVHPRPVESVNPKGDLRVRVSHEHFKATGKYGAVCKLFMNYIGMPNDEYIGTGWLIGPTLIVTAGHCGVEADKALKYINVYFGYDGPDSVGKVGTTYRYGTKIAIPAEYLKANAAAHDVSFITLNEAVTNIKPIKYVSTPVTKTQAQMGVVGYPGDLDSGHFMYEEWIAGTIDLPNTKGLLSYEIDTYGGQSGSPIFWKDASTAVGVHVEGGFPNIGSVIGPAGNKFGEYILALKVLAGEKSSVATKVEIKGGKDLHAPGFALVRVEPGALKESAEAVSDTGGASATSESDKYSSGESDSASNSDDSDDDQRLPESQIDQLFGRRSGKQGKLFKGKSVLHFPASLVLKKAGNVAAPTAEQLVDATKKAVDHPDVQTTFFIGFPPGNLDAKGTEQLKETVGLVQSWQAWSSSVCEGNVQQKIDSKELSANDDGQFARSTHRAKVFDYLFRQSTWFAKTFDQDMTKKIEVQRVDFHAAILKAILDGFAVPVTAFVQLEKILTTIGNNIEFSRTKTQDRQQYWLMLTRYDYQELIQTAQPVIRVISFSIDQKMSEYIAGKSKYTSISIDMQFAQYQADFITDIYKMIRESIDDKLVNAGMELVNQKTITVPL